MFALLQNIIALDLELFQRLLTWNLIEAIPGEGKPNLDRPPHQPSNSTIVNWILVCNSRRIGIQESSQLQYLDTLQGYQSLNQYLYGLCVKDLEQFWHFPGLRKQKEERG